MKKMKRLLSLVLCLALIAGLLPAVFAAASEPVPFVLADQIESRVADPATLNDWQAFFGPDTKTTEYAGGVWTDKSVFTAVPSQFSTVTMDDADTNFLVALSAIGSTKEVVGYATTPTDTVFVLDLSGSMDNSDSVTAMVRATNAAIARLLELNYNNRVGVVLYSGNSEVGASATSTGTVILPLDRYTTTSSEYYAGESLPQYLTGNDQKNQVSVAYGTKNAAGARPTGSKSVVGGTYIQNGLYQAWGQFEAVTDTVIAEGNVQAGANRMPILVLMSDGAPTTGTVGFADVGTSDTGTGQEDPCANAEMAFLTQLTASWVRSQLAEKYGTAPRFYTLGLGTASSNVATAVLNPAATGGLTSGYWKTYENLNTNGTMTLTLYNTAYSGNGPNQQLRTHTGTVTKVADPMARDYVDEYWYANNAAGLIDAFNSIVDEIIIQSRYYSTLVTSGNHALDGYITFTDHLGAFMEVKDMKGILISDDRLCTGAGFAQAAVDGDFGTALNPTELGRAMIAVFAQRFGVDVATAWSLLENALVDGQIAWSAAGHSNYIGWYADEDGNYLGPWATTDGAAPAGAARLNKSYLYLGTERTSHTYSDMMYAVVQVSAELATGEQTVNFAIPASLVPMVTYQVTTNSDQLTAESLTSITNDAAGKSPMRLVFEVGLVDTLDPVNLAEVMADPEVHKHETGDGGYWFYSNRWAVEDYSDPTTHQATTSHFHPSLQNERYYYTADTAIYIDAYGATKLTSAPEAGRTYFRKLTYVDGTDGLTLKDKYVPIASVSLNADHLTVIDGVYHIKAGTVYQEVGRFITDKTENVTDTLAYSDYPLVYQPEGAQDATYYDVYALLGNNGRYTMYPAQGIALTKTLTGTVAGGPTAFTFDIALDMEAGEVAFTDENGKALEVSGSYADGMITVTLAAGQTVYITGLPTGAAYTITERHSDSYKVVAESGTSGVIEAYTIAQAAVTNGPRLTGDLVLSKDVAHPFATAPAQRFQFLVSLAGQGDKTFQTSLGTVTTDENGLFTVELADNETVTIYGIPEDTAYIVSERTASGYPLDAAASSGMTGTIPGGGTAYAHAVNRYTTTPVTPELTLTGTKTLVGREWLETDRFTFQVQQWNGTGFEDVQGLTATVTQAQQTYTIAMGITYDTPGTYYYRIYEVPGDNPGIRYATNEGMFYVVVADENQDGQLEATVHVTDASAVLSGSTLTTDFVNTYTTTTSFPVTLQLQKEIRDENGAVVENLPLSGFLFKVNERYAVTDASGQATVELELTQGTHTVTVQEVTPELADRIPGMTYNDRTWTFTFDVRDTGTGQLIADIRLPDGTGLTGASGLTDTVTVVNTYDLEPVNVTLSGSKELLGRESLAGETFTFDLVQTDSSFTAAVAGGHTQSLTAPEGPFAFGGLEFTEVGSYYYTVTERAGTAGGMSYDDAQYHITVRVTLAPDGTLAADTQIVKLGLGDADSLDFVNTYTVTDSEVVELGGTKALTGRDMAQGEFTFVLALSDGTVVDTATNAADGSFAFDPITYTAPGTWAYQIYEQPGTAGGIRYDDAVYQVTVTVTDNGDGTLSKTVSGGGEIAFTNEYDPTPATLTLDGTKILVGGGLSEGQFSFLLHRTDADFEISLGSRASIASNDAQGGFRFDMVYDTPGTRYYALVEDTSDPQAEILYDAALYRIEVEVVDDGQGNLSASYTWAATGVTGEEIEFVNVPYEQITEKDVFLAAEPEISIDGERVQVGQELLYTISYTNYNRYPADVTITDRVPEHTSYVEGSGGTLTDGELRWDFQQVAVGQTVTVSFRVTVDAPDVTVVNQALVMDGVNTYRTNEVTNHTWEDIPGTGDWSVIPVLVIAMASVSALFVLILAGKKEEI